MRCTTCTQRLSELADPNLTALSTVKQATLAQVAPGIAEALIATAFGLFAAIPAVIAYNRFNSGIENLSTQYELFIEEFVVLLQRQAHS